MLEPKYPAGATGEQKIMIRNAVIDQYKASIEYNELKIKECEEEIIKLQGKIEMAQDNIGLLTNGIRNAEKQKVD